MRAGIRPAAAQAATAVARTLRVRLTARQLRVLRSALRRHRRAVLTVIVDAVDAAGNVATKTVRVRVER